MHTTRVLMYVCIHMQQPFLHMYACKCKHLCVFTTVLVAVGAFTLVILSYSTLLRNHRPQIPRWLYDTFSGEKEAKQFGQEVQSQNHIKLFLAQHSYNAYLWWRNSPYFNLSIQPHEALVARLCPDFSTKLSRTPKIQVQLVHISTIHVVPKGHTCGPGGTECLTPQAGWVIGIMLRSFNIHIVTWNKQIALKIE